MKELNDLSLVTRVAVLHDRRAFDTLVRKYQSPVRRFFLHQTLGDEQLSDDLAQDTFVKAYTHITAFRGLSGFSTWLFRIAYNVFYDYMRSRRQQADLDTPEVARRTAAHADTSLWPCWPTVSAPASPYNSSRDSPSTRFPKSRVCPRAP